MKKKEEEEGLKSQAVTTATQVHNNNKVIRQIFRNLSVLHHQCSCDPRRPESLLFGHSVSLLELMRLTVYEAADEIYKAIGELKLNLVHITLIK